MKQIEFARGMGVCVCKRERERERERESLRRDYVITRGPVRRPIERCV